MGNEDKFSFFFRNICFWMSSFMVLFILRYLVDKKRCILKLILINLRWKILCDIIVYFIKIEIDCIYNFILFLFINFVVLLKKVIKFVWYDLFCLNFCFIMFNIIIFIYFINVCNFFVNIYFIF